MPIFTQRIFMSSAIRFTAVSKIYRIPSLLPWQRTKKIEALTDTNFTCPEGAITCLLGPNGAGKTTIVKILAGLVTHDKGIVEIGGKQYDGVLKHGAAKIGVMASNDRSFYWRLTGRQNLEFFSSLYGYKGRAVSATVSGVLAELGIGGEADKPFRVYSSGIKQKFLLARALLCNPDILLMDEPTSHIDPIAKEGIHALISDNLIGKRKSTILLCSHDLYEVEKLADNIILLDSGRVSAAGTPRELKTMLGPGIAFTIEFSRMPSKNWARRIPVTIITQEMGRIELRARNRNAIAATVSAAVAGGGRVTACREIDESIIDIFSRLKKADMP